MTIVRRLPGDDRPRPARGNGGRIEWQRRLVGEGGHEGVAVGPREHLDRYGGVILRVIIEEEGMRRDISAGVVDEARTSLPKHCGQSQPSSCDQRPRPHGDDDRIRLDDAAIDLDTRDGRSAARRTMPVTRPRRSSAPWLCAARMMAVVNARGWTIAVVSVVPSREAMMTPSASQPSSADM